MGDVFFDDRTSIARTRHQCEGCGAMIEVGETYLRQTGVFWGEFFSRAVHRFCKELWYQGLDDNELPEWESMLQHFLETHVGEPEWHECLRASRDYRIAQPESPPAPVIRPTTVEIRAIRNTLGYFLRAPWGVEWLLSGWLVSKRDLERLVRNGWAESQVVEITDDDGFVKPGRRPRMGYRITPAGRMALRHLGIEEPV